MRRRELLRGVAALAAVGGARVARAQAPPSPEFALAYEGLVGGRDVRAGRVTLEMPRLADNGHSVPARLAIESALPPAAHVTQVTLLSPRNPRPVMATFHFGPRAGHARVSTRVRLNGSQRVIAIAQFSDGTLWSGEAPVEVTESACLDAG